MTVNEMAFYTKIFACSLQANMFSRAPSFYASTHSLSPTHVRTELAQEGRIYQQDMACPAAGAAPL